MSTIYVRMSHYAHTLYFTDLIGAITFGLLTFLILDKNGMIVTLLFLLMTLFIIQMLFSYVCKNIKIFLLSALLIAAAISASTLNLTSFERRFGELLAMNKVKLYSIEKDGKTRIEYTKWDSFSRTDVVDTGDEKSKIIFIDGGAASEMYRFDGNLESISWLKSTPGFLPFTLQKKPKTLVIGPGGGKDILLALLAGSEDITAVEINKSSIRAVKAFAPFTGDIYNLPQVKTYAGDGRNFIEQTKEKYDTIFLSLVMTEAAGSGGLALTENYSLGSLASKKFKSLRKDLPLVLAGGIVMMAILYRAVFPGFLGKSFYFKLSIVTLILIPIGFLMGVFFPAGIEKVRQLGKPSLIPLMWGINGVASLLGSTLAIVIAGLFGFTYSMLLSAAAYSLLIFSIRDMWM
ncbi:hypothetical protein L1766_06145 [Thermovorax subterraneus]|nr:hypothetical protein [Thermovorax subterraneus]